MSNAIHAKTFAAICPFCKRTWYPQSDGYNEFSCCDECEPERIEAALKARADKEVTFQDVGDYTIEVPTPEGAVSASRALNELFKPRPLLFPSATDEPLLLPGNMDKPWPTRDAIERICTFTEQQLSRNNYNGHGYEELQAAASVVREALTQSGQIGKGKAPAGCPAGALAISTRNVSKAD